MKRLLMIVGALIALTVPAPAQIVQNTLTGNETWSVGQGPGGPSNFITSNLTRNTTGVLVSTATTGAVIATQPTANLILTAALAGAVTVTLPASPVPDGQIFEVINGTTSAFTQNVVLQPAAGQTLVGGNITIATMAAGASRELRYALSTNSWYPVR